MNFDDTPQEAEFRAKARTFLSKHLEPLDPGETAPNMLGEREDKESIAWAKRWQATKFDNGWAVLTWPKEYGGQGMGRMENVIFGQEEARFKTPKNAHAHTPRRLWPQVAPRQHRGEQFDIVGFFDRQAGGGRALGKLVERICEFSAVRSSEGNFAVAVFRQGGEDSAMPGGKFGERTRPVRHGFERLKRGGETSNELHRGYKFVASHSAARIGRVQVDPFTAPIFFEKQA